MTIKKIAIVGIVGVPANYGGFETLVDNLLDGKNEYTVYCSSKAFKNKIYTYKGASLIYIPLNSNGISSIPYDIVSILHALKSGYRRILILGVSGSLILPIVRIFVPSAYIVTNIDGMEWKRTKWRRHVQLILKFFEKIAVKYSHRIICDNQSISDYVSEEYGANSHLIAYGGDHAIINMPIGISENYALSICRIEPENNISVILEAFAQTGHLIKFVGNWRASKYGLDLVEKYSEFSNIELLDPIFDIRKLFELRSRCKFYVHGHSAGGTNPSLVEIMHFSKPIIAYDCEFNRATLENTGLYFMDKSSLTFMIEKSTWKNCDTDAIEEVAKRRYTWQVIREQYNSIFE